MGLALGIDYSLFVLSRFREERARGQEVAEAIGTAGATASRAVLFSGLAFALAMGGMVLVPDTILRSLAVGAILVGVVSVMAALTLLPALLGLLGDRVNALRLPIVGRSLGRPGGVEGGFWSRVVQAVVHRPVGSLVISAGLLLALAVPVLDLDRGFAGVSTLPDRFPSKQGLLALETSFPGATTEPAKVVIDGQVHAPQAKTAIDRLRQALEGRSRFGPATLEENDAGDLAVLSVPVGSDAQSAEAYAAVRELREELIPAAFAGVDAQVLVTGDTAENLDYFAIIGFWLPLVFAFVLGLSCWCWSSSTALRPTYSACSGSTQSRPGCRCSCSRCCSGCPWTTRCSCSAASTSATAKPATSAGRWCSGSARPPGSSPVPPSSSWSCSAASPPASW
jgi:RND superfamily putative drug exporter